MRQATVLSLAIWLVVATLSVVALQEDAAVMLDEVDGVTELLTEEGKLVHSDGENILLKKNSLSNKLVETSLVVPDEMAESKLVDQFIETIQVEEGVKANDAPSHESIESGQDKFLCYLSKNGGDTTVGLSLANQTHKIMGIDYVKCDKNAECDHQALTCTCDATKGYHGDGSTCACKTCPSPHKHLLYPTLLRTRAMQ